MLEISQLIGLYKDGKLSHLNPDTKLEAKLKFGTWVGTYEELKGFIEDQKQRNEKATDGSTKV